MDAWLLWKLSGGKIHATDFSNASRTMLLNLNTLAWDDELIDLFSLTKDMLPELKFNDEVFGHTDPTVVFNEPVAIGGMLGDSHAALFGQNCFEQGMAKSTYGTGSSIMMNIGDTPYSPPEGLVTSVGFGLNKKVDFVFEGNIHCTGDTINWLVGDLQLINDAKESEALATSVEDNNGVYFVPAFVGLGAPYWDNDARAAISGMSRNTKKAHVVRAALESIGYQIKDVIDLMISKSGIELKVVNVDGGPTRNNFLMQFQSDILGRTIVRTNIEEISALGTAFMAGLATGFWKDLDEISKLRVVDRTFDSQMKNENRDSLYTAWKTAVKRARLI
jgi:glycerol kinase